MLNLDEKRQQLALWDMVFKVIESGSISSAAAKNGLERSKLSREIARLEEEVGFALLERMGRKVYPTQQSLVLKKKLEPIIRQFRKTLQEAAADQDSERGEIRFGAMPGFLQTQIVPMIAEFQQKHPGITFDVIADDNPEAFMHGQADMMLYYEYKNDPRLMEYWVTRSAFVPCASPEYLKRNGNPMDPQDLLDHAGVIYVGKVRPLSTMLQYNGVEKPLNWRSQIRFNNILIAKSAALAGAGILVDLPLHHCINELLDGRLIPVLNGWHVRNLDNYLGTTKQAGELKRVRLFVEWYIRQRREIEGEQRRRVLEKFPFVSFD